MIFQRWSWKNLYLFARPSLGRKLYLAGGRAKVATLIRAESSLRAAHFRPGELGAVRVLAKVYLAARNAGQANLRAAVHF